MRDVSDFYDEFAEYELRYLKEGNPRLEAIHQLLRPLIVERNPRKALDVGCGIGITTAWLAERIDQVTGVDISARTIELAEHHHTRPTFAVCGVPDEPLPRGSYDLVGLFDALEHFPPNARPGVFARIADVVADDGVLAVNLPSRLLAKAIAGHETEQIIDEAVGADEVVSLAAEIGMEPLTLHRYGIENANQYVFCAFSRTYDVSAISSPAWMQLVAGLRVRGRKWMRRSRP